MVSFAQNACARAMPGPSPRVFELGALFGRIERLEARRLRHSPAQAAAAPHRLDQELLAEGVAFEAAWAREIAALIAVKRQTTSETRRAASETRAETERLAARIEAAHCRTLDGLKVKARAQLWRRNGEPAGGTLRPRIVPPGKSAALAAELACVEG
ncbi:MAG: hypothetical protein JO234_08030 [Hyphomicrobiales bacterium]|nr:hypothetical protein [Hyphomicrobiales bacterium]